MGPRLQSDMDPERSAFGAVWIHWPYIWSYMGAIDWSWWRCVCVCVLVGGAYSCDTLRPKCAPPLPSCPTMCVMWGMSWFSSRGQFLQTPLLTVQSRQLALHAWHTTAYCCPPTHLSLSTHTHTHLDLYTFPGECIGLQENSSVCPW